MSASKRMLRLGVGAGTILLVLALTVVLLRRPLLGAAITTSLKRAGAGDIRFEVAEASPWHVRVADVAFNVRTQRFAAREVTLQRASWWQPSLGVVRVDGARVPLVLDGSDTNPWAWSTYSGNGSSTASVPTAVPAEQVTVDGVLVVQVAGERERELRVQFDARWNGGTEWTGRVDASAPGIEVHGEGTYDLARDSGRFHVAQAELDLGAWAGFVRQLAPLPGGHWEIGGRVRGSGDIAIDEGKMTSHGAVDWREGVVALPERNLRASGVEASFVFEDLNRFRSRPGTLRMAELQAGTIRAGNVELELAFDGTERIAVSRATLQAFGGRLSAEPFKFFPLQQELEATLLVDGIVVEQVLALAKDVPAKATGLVDGRVPIRIDASGLRFGSGFLELKRGAYAEVQFNASGLLTRGVSPTNPSYTTLQRVESGLLRLRLSELRLDLRPPNAPPGRTATIKMSGQPVDPNVKAPVNLDLNVNGPLEQLLNLGLDRRISFGTF